VINYQQIGDFLQQTQRLSTSLRELSEALRPVVQLTERLGQMDSDLTAQRDSMYHEIRSVELLGDMLTQHMSRGNRAAGSRPGEPMRFAAQGREAAEVDLVDQDLRENKVRLDRVQH